MFFFFFHPRLPPSQSCLPLQKNFIILSAPENKALVFALFTKIWKINNFFGQLCGGAMAPVAPPVAWAVFLSIPRSNTGIAQVFVLTSTDLLICKAITYKKFV